MRKEGRVSSMLVRPQGHTQFVMVSNVQHLFLLGSCKGLTCSYTKSQPLSLAFETRLFVLFFSAFLTGIVSLAMKNEIPVSLLLFELSSDGLTPEEADRRDCCRCLN